MTEPELMSDVSAVAQATTLGVLDNSEPASLQWIYRLHELARQCTSGADGAMALQRMLEHIVSGFSATSGSLALVNEEGNGLNIVAGIDIPASVIGRLVAFGEGILGSVAQKGEPQLLVGDLSAQLSLDNTLPARQSPRPASAICWPLLGDNNVIGVLCLNRKIEHAAFQQADLQRGSLVIGLISLVVDNTRLTQESKNRIENLLLMNAALEDLNAKLEDTQSDLDMARARLQHLLESSPAVIYSARPDAELTLSFVSDNVQQLLGYRPKQFVQDPTFWRGHIHHDDVAGVAEKYECVPNEACRIHEYRFLCEDGHYIWMHDEQRFIRDDNAQVKEIVGYWVDVTERKKTEEALFQEKQEQKELIEKLKQAQDQLLQSEKLASIGQLAAGVAHEINNPIGYIGSNVRSLSQYTDDLLTILDLSAELEAQTAQDSPALVRLMALKKKCNFEFLRADLNDLIDESLEGVERVSQIVKDLKDFSRVDQADWQWACLQDGINSTLNIVRSELKYKAEVVKEYADLPNVQCVPAQLNQVFMNLLVNAGHAIEDKGVITVRTGSDDERSVWVEVADTGKGIDEAHMRKIFDPFFTTKPVGKGTGLGLALSYGIVEKHAGRIDVKSTLGEGTTFRITLPIAQEDAGDEPGLAMRARGTDTAKGQE